MIRLPIAMFLVVLLTLISPPLRTVVLSATAWPEMSAHLSIMTPRLNHGRIHVAGSTTRFPGQFSLWHQSVITAARTVIKCTTIVNKMFLL